MKCKRCSADMETTAIRVTDDGTAQEFVCRQCGATKLLCTSNPKPITLEVWREGPRPEMTATCGACGFTGGIYSKSNNVKALCCDIVVMREDIYKCPLCKKTFKKRHENAGFALLNKLSAELPRPTLNHYQKEVCHG